MRSESTSPRLQRVLRNAVLASAAAVAPAWAATSPAASTTTPITLGSPAVDFSVGNAGVGSDAAVYFWVDANGVTHFTDKPTEFARRFREFFRPIDLFVDIAGQPKR